MTVSPTTSPRADAASGVAVTTGPVVDEVHLPGVPVRAWCTDGSANLSHRRPHDPGELARRRALVLEAVRDPGRDTDLVWMRQVHGAAVGRVTATTPAGAELRHVDALVTDQPGRVLAVQTADCVPVVLASPTHVAVAHAGRPGVVAGVTQAALAALPEPAPVALIGPAVRGCCYEVPAAMQASVGADHPDALAVTTWGTPSLDLPAATRSTLERAGVATVVHHGGCTRCGRPYGVAVDASEGEWSPSRWFSHRADPTCGRQVTLVRLAPDDAGEARP